MQPNLTLRFLLIYAVPRQAIDEAVREVGAAVAAGALTELPAHRFPLAGTPPAHEAVESGAVGKVLIDVAPE